MLKNRLEKNLKHLRKRLQREGIHCWRAYDQDLPEYAAAIDVYGDTARQRPPAHPGIPGAGGCAGGCRAPALREIARVAGEVLGVPRERIALKTRERGKGGSKYGQFDQRNEFIEVEEGGLKFLVNLTDYLDTGLFLDHRLVRGEGG